MKDKLMSIIISLYIIIFLFLNILMPDNETSMSERRKLNQLPKFDITFTDKFEKYALDQFAFRDNFRSIKANFNLNILNKKDNNKLVYKDGYIYKLEYPTNIKSIDNFINMINVIKEDLKDNKKYISIIPDKSYFLSDNYLKLDYDYIFNSVSNIEDVNYIPVNDILEVNDYYKTDTHWKQPNLIKVIDRISNYMKFEYNTSYEINKYENFNGVYYGQLGLNVKNDTLEYLTSSNIDNAIVDDIEHKNDKKVYNATKLDTYEPYDIYLNGSTPLLTITNNNISNDREIVIFRDSFGSSIAPIFIDSYYKVTLVDLRYIDYKILNEYLTIENQDILFLYSTLIVNNSDSLKY